MNKAMKQSFNAGKKTLQSESLGFDDLTRVLLWCS
jgi:hypothetical protein